MRSNTIIYFLLGYIKCCHFNFHINTVAEFQTTNDDYLINEPDLIMPVRVAKNPDIRLANPVSLRVTPLTVDEAVRRGIVEDTIIPNNEISPNRARKG